MQQGLLPFALGDFVANETGVGIDSSPLIQNPYNPSSLYDRLSESRTPSNVFNVRGPALNSLSEISNAPVALYENHPDWQYNTLPGSLADTSGSLPTASPQPLPSIVDLDTCQSYVAFHQPNSLPGSTSSNMVADGIFGVEVFNDGQQPLSCLPFPAAGLSSWQREDDLSFLNNFANPVNAFPIPNISSHSDLNSWQIESTQIPPHSARTPSVNIEQVPGELSALTRIPCTHLTCTKTFKRDADRIRHESSLHTANLGFHLCPVVGCVKSQGAGYCRADKVTEHLWKKHADLGYTKGRL